MNDQRLRGSSFAERMWCITLLCLALLVPAFDGIAQIPDPVATSPHAASSTLGLPLSLTPSREQTSQAGSPSAKGSLPSPHRVVRIGAFNYFPGIFRDNDGTIKGFYVDLLEVISKHRGWKIEYVYGTWAEGLERIKRGEVDLLTSVAMTEERKGFLEFPQEPLLTVWGEVYVHDSTSLDSIFALKDKRVALMKDDFNGAAFKKLALSFNIPCAFQEVGGFDDVLRLVQEKAVDAGVVNSTFGAGKGHLYAVKASGVVFNPFPIYFAALKGRNTDLLAELDGFLKNWKDDRNSSYYKGMRRWLQREIDVKEVTQPWVWKTLAGLGILLLGSVLFVTLLRRQVRLQTAEILETHHRLRDSEAKYRRLHESLRDAVAQIDMSGVITDCNPIFTDLTGYSLDELKHLTYLDLTPETWHETEKAILRDEVLPNGHSNVYEKEYRRKDGQIIPVELRAFLLCDDNDQPIGMWAIVRDISERKRLGQQLVQAQKMEFVGRLAGGVAHDFNNMLGVILGHVDLAMLEMNSDNRFYADLAEIKKAAKRSADLTRQLLGFARQQTTQPQILDLNETLSGMLKMLRRMIGEDLDLRWNPGNDLGKVLIDPSQLDQILANLAVNARDAMTKGGSLTIETLNATLEARSLPDHPEAIPGEYVLLKVSDTGHGIPASVRIHLFEPFFTTKEVGKGTGLGLATVHGIVRQNKGFITVDSTPGKGTTFTIYFPRQEESGAPPLPGPETKEIRGGNETILLVEDEPMLRQMTHQMLKSLGYQVLTAARPTEAPPIIEAHPGVIRLLLVDVIMPEMDGRSLAENLLSRHPTLKCLFMSGYSNEIIAQHGVLEPGLNFIHKPFTFHALAIKVREVLDAGS